MNFEDRLKEPHRKMVWALALIIVLTVLAFAMVWWVQLASVLLREFF